MNVIILRGVSGSGKSTYVQKIRDTYGSYTVAVCSADHYFIDSEGEYKFDAKKLSEAHSFCLRAFLNSCTLFSSEVDVIVVDNVNIHLHDISPYLRIAEMYRYDVEIVRCVCPINIAAKRNSHNVPEEVVRSQARRMENIPKYWPKEREVNTYVS